MRSEAVAVDDQFLRGGDLHAARGGPGMPITADHGPGGDLVHVDRGAIDEATLRTRMTRLFGVDA